MGKSVGKVVQFAYLEQQKPAWSNEASEWVMRDSEAVLSWLQDRMSQFMGEVEVETGPVVRWESKIEELADGIRKCVGYDDEFFIRFWCDQFILWHGYMVWNHILHMNRDIHTKKADKLAQTYQDRMDEIFK